MTRPAPSRWTLEAYRAFLHAKDWSYEYSDDRAVYRKGLEEHSALLYMAHNLDPDFTIWNSIAPRDEYKQHGPIL